MPTYEYVCRSCAHQFEIVQSFSDAALSECAQCKGSLRKVFGNVGITFKGTGFYKNDSRGSKSESGAMSDSSATAGSSTDRKSVV